MGTAIWKTVQDVWYTKPALGQAINLLSLCFSLSNGENNRHITGLQQELNKVMCAKAGGKVERVDPGTGRRQM